MDILIIDGQGGNLGRQLTRRLREALPRADITAVGTNSTATENMLKGGADRAATGENAVVVNARRAKVIAGLFYKLLPKKTPYLYVALILAMIGGRLVWGLAQTVLMGLSGKSFTLAAFWAGAFANAWPGIILQLVLIPPVVAALKKAKLMLNE